MIDYSLSTVTYIVHWPMLSDIAYDYRRHLIASNDSIPDDRYWLSSFNDALNTSLNPDIKEYREIAFVGLFGVEVYEELFHHRFNNVLDWYKLSDDMLLRLELIELLHPDGTTRLTLQNPLLYGMS